MTHDYEAQILPSYTTSTMSGKLIGQIAGKLQENFEKTCGKISTHLGLTLG